MTLYRRIFSFFLRGEFLRFLALGGISTLVNIFVRFVLSFYLCYSVAIIISYCVGMVMAYVLFRSFVFNSNKSSQEERIQEIIRFTVVNLWGLLQTLLVSLILVNYIFPYIKMNFYPQDIAHIVSLCFLVGTSYVGHKFFTFHLKV